MQTKEFFFVRVLSTEPPGRDKTQAEQRKCRIYYRQSGWQQESCGGVVRLRTLIHGRTGRTPVIES